MGLKSSYFRINDLGEPTGMDQSDYQLVLMTPRRIEATMTPCEGRNEIGEGTQWMDLPCISHLGIKTVFLVAELRLRLPYP